ALKTIYALSMGIVEGYFKQTLGGNVDNTLFHLSNRFFKEMTEIGIKLGGHKETFQGLSGLTDFMLACFGSDTRDRKHGFDLAMGNQLDKISNGFYGLRVLPNLIKINKEEYPVVASAYEVVIQKKNLEEIINKMQEQLLRPR
ncbi:MAG: glycerol-3-phosphate acyltransferase, partial [Leptospiraceae bacterium]|nr:glycerol-3-phosphate acyltransferase [Leptospiraceae bacterium]